MPRQGHLIRLMVQAQPRHRKDAPELRRVAALALLLVAGDVVLLHLPKAASGSRMLAALQGSTHDHSYYIIHLWRTVVNACRYLSHRLVVY